jgi:hypothetical protein
LGFRARTLTAVAAMAATAGLSGCGGSGVSSVPPTHGVAITAFRPLDSCSSAVHVPGAAADAAPSRALPPTIVLRHGAAVALTAPGTSSLGLSGPADAAERSVVCVARAGGRVVLVAGQPGYVRVVVRNKTTVLGLVLVKVTS